MNNSSYLWLNQIADSINVDDGFALDVVAGERILIAQPLITAEQGTDWEGSLVFRRRYLLDLLRYSVEYAILSPEEVLNVIKIGEDSNRRRDSQESTFLA